MNSLAGALYKDFVSMILPTDMSDKAISNVLKIIVVAIGVVTTVMVFVVEQLGGLLSLSFSFAGITYGPTLGAFTLGMLVPSATKKVSTKL